MGFTVGKQKDTSILPAKTLISPLAGQIRQCIYPFLNINQYKTCELESMLATIDSVRSISFHISMSHFKISWFIHKSWQTSISYILFDLYSKKSLISRSLLSRKLSRHMAISESNMYNTCANQKIPSLFTVFVSPTLAFGTPKAKGDGRTSMKWRNITDVSLHELLPLYSLLLNLASLASRFFPHSPSTKDKWLLLT